MNRVLPALAATAVFLGVPTASAKEFPPGTELRICGATRCRVISDGPTIRRFGEFLYGSGPVALAPTARVGSPVFVVRFRNGPAGVILNATSARVHGLNCGRFRRGRWYRLPRPLRRLTTGLRPKRLRAWIPPSC
jgi:hypothetical protein